MMKNNDIAKIYSQVNFNVCYGGNYTHVAKTASAAGIDKALFDCYYSGRTVAVAYALGSVTRYDIPHGLSDYGIKSAPQYYVYIRESNHGA